MRVLSLLVVALLAACGDNSPQRTDAADTETSEEALYTCPMHPHYISTDPDGSCPICGMDLVSAGAADTIPEAGAQGIAVSPEIIQTIGVRTELVRRTSLRRTLRAFGTVEANERRETVVASRLEGWIEELAVRAEGDAVEADTILYRVYSPNLIAAQKDYLNALDIGNERRIEAVRQRLVSLGMQDPSIRELGRTRSVIERLPIRADRGGIVAELNVRSGDYVKPGDAIMTLQSYDDVWVMAEIPEQDLHLVTAGAEASLAFPSAPALGGSGEVDYIYPTIDPATRTGRLRIVVGNASGSLRPGAYADIRIETDAGTVLAVPSEAILRDSRGAHVIVALGEGRFLPRAVTTGLPAGGVTEVTAGLEEGERVVSSGQYLLDSEAKLRAGFSALSRPAAGPQTPLSEIPVDQADLGQIDHFVDMALYFHEALTDGYSIEPSFIDPVLALGEVLSARFAGTRLAPIIEGAQAALREARVAEEGNGLPDALASLMASLDPWLVGGAPQHYAGKDLVLFEDTAGRRWVQEGGTAQNPFGDEAFETVDWPRRIASVQPAGPRPIDPHANH
ncbi:MAG: efflux RND transporter periplasmic adaptor subunit [Pseudomonadota bacterium]